MNLARRKLLQWFFFAFAGSSVAAAADEPAGAVARPANAMASNSWKSAMKWMPATTDADYQPVSPEAREVWRDRKFGMRIHFGVYNVIGADASGHMMKGVAPEYIRLYRTLYQVFDPSRFDAEEWAQLAEDSGMRYFVLTTKHTDGFCLFDTQTSVLALRRVPNKKVPGLGPTEECRIHYSVMDTPFQRDIVAEMVAAFRRHHMGIGLYYSNVDSNDFDQRFLRGNYSYDPSYTRESDPEGFRRAIARQTQQLRELATHYGKIDEIDFDSALPRALWPEVVKMVKMVRQLQPDALFRNRGLGPYGDFETPEHWVPKGPDDPRLNLAWQAIEEIGTGWAYQPNDTYKSKEWILGTLIDCTAMGGNFMVGISPMPDGRLPPETVERLLWVGQWLKVNGEAIYATRPWRDWGEGKDVRFTRSKDGRIVYVIERGKLGPTFVSSLLHPAPGSRVTMLGVSRPLDWTWSEGKLAVQIPGGLAEHPPSEFACVFRIKLPP